MLYATAKSHGKFDDSIALGVVRRGKTSACVASGNIPSVRTLGRLIILYAEFACQLFLVAAGLWPAIWLVQTLSVFADASWKWLLLLLGATLTFVYGYFLALLGVRLVTPYPIEGYFSRGAGGKPPRAMIVFMLNAYLTKARYFPPWTEMFGLAIVNTFPLSQLYRHFFGPHRKGILTGGLVYLPDPYLVYAGRNVVLGGGALITCHVYDQRGLFVKRVVIEDDVTIGAFSKISPGVKIRKGAMIGRDACVAPNTQVGAYEYWAGDPARYIKKIKPPGGAAIRTGERASDIVEETQVKEQNPALHQNQ